MSIVKSGYGTAAIRYGTQVIQAVYYGVHLVWQSVRSCFGSGVWITEKPWLDEETWKNNN